MEEYIKYSLSISLFSPLSNLYQLSKLNNFPLYNNIKLCANIYPSQVFLRFFQIELSTEIKKISNPWIAFGSIGILQGLVYGHANIFFSKRLLLNSSYNNILKGSFFAFGRDIISQGVPYMYSENLFNNKYLSVITLSVISTYLSQGIHNCQTTLQTTNIRSINVIPYLYNKHNFSFLWKGVSGRMGLLLITNLLNEHFLKPCWKSS